MPKRWENKENSFERGMSSSASIATRRNEENVVFALHLAKSHITTDRQKKEEGRKWRKADAAILFFFTGAPDQKKKEGDSFRFFLLASASQKAAEKLVKNVTANP